MWCWSKLTRKQKQTVAVITLPNDCLFPGECAYSKISRVLSDGVWGRGSIIR